MPIDALLYTLLFFVLGLTLGSFYNVVGLRGAKNEPFLNERSECPACKHKLKTYELIPVLSYLLQLGKCRNCGKKISWIYPVIELSTGLLFALAYVQSGFSVELFISLSLVSMLVILFVSDISYMLIPNKVLLFFTPLFIIGRILNPLEPWWSSLLGAVVGGGIILLVIVLSKGGMGAGDMKLFVVLGLVLGLKFTIITFMLSCIIGAIVGAVLLGFKVIKRKQPFPFGPSIIVATLIIYFVGEELLQWYMGIY